MPVVDAQRDRTPFSNNALLPRFPPFLLFIHISSKHALTSRLPTQALLEYLAWSACSPFAIYPLQSSLVSAHVCNRPNTRHRPSIPPHDSASCTAVSIAGTRISASSRNPAARQSCSLPIPSPLSLPWPPLMPLQVSSLPSPLPIPTLVSSISLPPITHSPRFLLSRPLRRASSHSPSPLRPVHPRR